MAKTIAEVLAENRPEGSGRSISEFDGQKLTILDYEVKPSKFDDVWLIVQAVTEDGDEVEISTSSVGVVTVIQALSAAELLPAELRVVSGVGQYGKNWYGLEEV